MKIEGEIKGKTFDDFLFYPQYGTARRRRDVDLRTNFSRNIFLNLPIVSANMDTVTEAPMAIAVAMAGGIGIIHRNLTIESQAEEVRKVKRAENFIIPDPYTINENEPVERAIKIMEEKNVGTLIVLNEHKALTGILTTRDIRFLSPRRLHVPVSQIMTSRRNPNQRLIYSSKGKINSIQDAADFLRKHRIKKLILVDKDLKLTGLITSKDVERLINYPLANKDVHGRLKVGAAIGATGDFLERADELIGVGADVLVIDIAHGHSENMRDAIENFKKSFPNLELVCGNVGTYDGAKFLKQLGVDGVKVGLGPGFGCRTRLETGAGVTQLQAIRESFHALNDEIPIIADGGVKNDKDIFSALMFGASSVMLGSALSGTDESPGEIIPDPATGIKRKIYRGMTAPETKVSAQNKPEYIEGQEKSILYRGSVNDILTRIREHLQSAVSYAGEEFLERARQKIVNNPLDFFTVLSEASKRESFER